MIDDDATPATPPTPSLPHRDTPLIRLPPDDHPWSFADSEAVANKILGGEPVDPQQDLHRDEPYPDLKGL